MSNSGAIPFVLPGLTVLVGMSRFFGSFTVEPGRLTFESSDGLINDALNIEKARSLVHTDAGVTAVWGRLLPPSLNTGVILVDCRQAGSRRTGVLQMPNWNRRPLVAALRSAGFAPEVFRTRTSMGGQIGSLTEPTPLIAGYGTMFGEMSTGAALRPEGHAS